jgi:hypothetical protein
MSQSSSVKSLDGLSPTPDLKPALKVALGSMDVELEAELARYRRLSKKAQPLTPVLIADIPEGKIQEPPLDVAPESQPPPATPAAAPAPVSSSSATPIEGVDPTTIPPAERTSAPKDYLDSSEELLRSTDEPDVAESAAPKSSAWLTPLGIGSVLLFLLAAATLGYVMFNRSSLENRGLNPAASQKDIPNSDRVSPSDSPKASEEQKMPSGPNLASQEFVDLDLNSLSSADPRPEPIPSPIPAPTSTPTAGTTSPSPSESADSLNNLNSVLSPLPSPAQSNGTVDQKPTPSSSPSTTATPSPTASPSPEASNPATEAVAELPDPIVNNDYYGFYFVVIDADPQLWTKATVAVPDAYNRTFPIGDRIQMGAFEEREDAEKLVESLKAQNLSPEIYQPEE